MLRLGTSRLAISGGESRRIDLRMRLPWLGYRSRLCRISRRYFGDYVSRNQSLRNPRLVHQAQQSITKGRPSQCPCRFLNWLRLFGSEWLTESNLPGISELRRESRRLASLMDEQVSPIGLDGVVLDQAIRKMNRLTTAYASALSWCQGFTERTCLSIPFETNTD